MVPGSHYARGSLQIQTEGFLVGAPGRLFTPRSMGGRVRGVRRVGMEFSGKVSNDTLYTTTDIGGTGHLVSAGETQTAKAVT